MNNLDNLIDLIGENDIVIKGVSSEYQKPEFADRIKSFFREKRFTVKDTGVSYRMINHWKDVGIIPDSCFDDKNQDWAKFNLVELLWLKVANELRSFGLPLEKIKRVKKDILIWNEKQQTYLDFEYRIYLSITTKSDLFLFIESDGSTQIQSLNFFIFMKNILNSFGWNFPKMILISMKDLVKDYVFMVERPDDILSISKPEMELLNKIRLGTGNKITVHKKDRKISDILTSDFMTENIDISKVMKNLKEEGGNTEVVLKLNNGNPEFLEVKRKKRV